ncbi:metallophosphoesterase [Chitinophaga sp. Cy-1792]|uniref:metallophosphoesterase family protein n=1 Tax=Chitinophaga sp. Cy-1792 TaxID=2608339 RepID=UPI0014221766|nr:metallophosphoesterase family protein [Chitinophaga sp. Cy-1792]NIG55405.1 metallophosphoesterase family protein [Chitinophaga sp. Cy-1792]
MIQIAVISDIHANIIALEAVLQDIAARNITQIYCLGDLVDFAPWGNEVIALIRDRNIPCLLGNHDERIAFDKPVIPLPHHDVHETACRHTAIAYSKHTITAANKRWLAQCPYHLQLTFKTGNRYRKILLVHGSPRSNEEYIYAPEYATAAAMLEDKSVDALLMGHIHQSYIQRHDQLLVVNCGSVGRSREPDRLATYSVLQISEAGVDAEIIKLSYDNKYVAQAIYNSEIPDFYGDFLLGR